MNCSEFEKVVIEIARNGMGDAAALAHAQACTRCGRRLANEQTLTGAMASLASEDAARGASAETEGALLAEFRQRHQAARPRFRLAYAMGAIAAVLLLAIAVSLRRGESPPAPDVKPAPRSAVQPARTEIVAPVFREARKPRPQLRKVVRRRPPAPPKPQSTVQAREIMTDFIPVVYDPTPIGRGHLVRIRLPRAAITAFGLPVNEQRADQPIQADVLLGDDGLARAVRFVK